MFIIIVIVQFSIACAHLLIVNRLLSEWLYCNYLEQYSDSVNRLLTESLYYNYLEQCKCSVNRLLTE